MTLTTPLHRAFVLALVAAATTSSLADGGQQADVPTSSRGDAVLRCGAGGRSFDVSLEGAVSAAAQALPRGVACPDGTRAWLEVRGKGPRSERVIEVQPATGGAPRALAIGPDALRDLCWRADGTLLVQGREEGHLGVFAIDPADAAPKARRLSPPDRDCMLPAASPAGPVAWAEVTRRDGKAVYKSIILQDGAETRTLLRDVDASVLAFSRDGARLAVGCIGTMIILDVASGAELARWEYHALDARLYAHLPYRIAWAPDGATLAFDNHFAGGRMSMGDEPPELIFGDREVFILKPEGVLVVDAAGGGGHLRMDPLKRLTLHQVTSPGAHPGPRRLRVARHR